MARELKASTDYTNNPFTIAVSGLTLLFNLARGVGFLLVGLSALNLFRADFSVESNSYEDWTVVFEGWTSNEWLLAVGAVVIVMLAIMVLAALVGGISAYTSLHLAHGEKVSLNDAVRVAFEKLWSYLWLQIIIFVKILLWSLLFIIPGIIMATRYSLAGVAFFDDKKNLRGNAAVKESIRLTRGAWITTFAANALFNYITFGVISSVLNAGTSAVLYAQYDKLGSKKPAAHWLSWLTLVLPFTLLAFLIIIIAVVALAIGFDTAP